jgi:hypothetical protein
MTKTKAPQKASELDRIAAQLHEILRRDTVSIVEKGKLLLRSRELLADEHGQWMPWLSDNFNLSYRTAINYCNAAEYVARKAKSATVATFSNLSPTVLYRLAEGGYSGQEEIAILRQAEGQRIDQSRASAICKAIETSYVCDASTIKKLAAAAAAAAAEAAAHLDGPLPAVPQPTVAPPPNYALKTFDEALTALKRIMTKPAAQFAGTVHAAGELEHVESFIHAVRMRLAPAGDGSIPNEQAQREEHGPGMP